MAAIFALILLPIIAALGFMTGSNVEGPTEAIVATLVFGLMAGGLFFGMFRMARRWEDESVDDGTRTKH
ncbi:MAG: hypothetical protein AB7P03_01000 [Kofleriaceae bacterium]